MSGSDERRLESPDRREAETLCEHGAERRSRTCGVAIDCLPRATRIAMLEGSRTNEIIVGAYSDGTGSARCSPPTAPAAGPT